MQSVCMSVNVCQRMKCVSVCALRVKYVGLWLFSFVIINILSLTLLNFVNMYKYLANNSFSLYMNRLYLNKIVLVGCDVGDIFP